MTKQQNISQSPFVTSPPNHIYNNLYQRSHSPITNLPNKSAYEQNFIFEKEVTRRF